MKPVYIEIGQSSFRALDGHDGLHLALERQPNGRLTPECAQRLSNSLRLFLRKHSMHSQVEAICALGARGVSLRRLSLPAGSKDEFQKLLLLQMEREFPLAPADLAWGCRTLGEPQHRSNGSPAIQDLLIVATKRDGVDEYSEILLACGLTPVFTLGALARAEGAIAGNAAPRSFTVLDIGQNQSELINYQSGSPQTLRVLPWGGAAITRALQKRLQIGEAEADRLKVRLEEVAVGDGQLADHVQAALAAELGNLAELLQSTALGHKLYVSGETTRLKGFLPQLTRVLGGKVTCERLEVTPGEGLSTAILGLQKLHEGNVPPLLLGLIKTKAGEPPTLATPWKWPVLALALLLLSIGFRYLEPFIQKPRLEHKLAQLEAARAQLPNVDRELAFLQFLKTNQPAYLEGLYTLANSVAGGTRIEALSMSRRGDFSLRAGLRNSDQVAELRSKLIDSGLFTSVVVEDQTPTPDRQKVNVRITGQWRATGERKAVTNAPPKNEKVKSAANSARTNTTAQSTNAVSATNVINSQPSTLNPQLP